MSNVRAAQLSASGSRVHQQRANDSPDYNYLCTSCNNNLGKFSQKLIDDLISLINSMAK